MTNIVAAQAKPVRAYENVTPAMFRDEIMPRGEPAVLKALVKDWPLVKAGARSFDAVKSILLEADTGQPVQTFNGAPEMKGRFFYSDDMKGFNFERRQEPLAELLDRLSRAQTLDTPPYFYAGAVNVPKHLTSLAAAHTMPLIPEGADQLMSVWVGNRTRIPPHWDLPSNIACVAAGQRQFTLFPISQIDNLYIGPIEHTLAGQPCSMVDLHAPEFDKYPRFKTAMKEARVADLEAGDALYMPSLWVHHVESLSDIGVLVNFWWRDLPEYMYTPTLSLMHALMSIKEMPREERLRWQTVFNHYIFRPDDNDPVAHLPEDARGILGELDDQKIHWLRSMLAHRLR